MNSTRIYVITIGILTALIGIFHGIFEVMQGNKSTGGLVLGNIGAITIIPNYLFTGIIAIIVGIAVILWTACYIHKKHGAAILLCLSILLVLAGGGIALIAGIVVTWAVSSRINKPVNWLKIHLSENSRMRLSGLWLPILITGFIFLFAGIGIWLVWLPPGGTNRVLAIEYTCWSFLAIGFLFQLLTIVSGFIRDLKEAW